MLKVVFVGHRDLYFGAESVMFRVMMLLKNKAFAEPPVVLPKSADMTFSRQCNSADIKVIDVCGTSLWGVAYCACVLCLLYNYLALFKACILLLPETRH